MMRWLLIGYVYLVIHRPFEIWPALGEFRIELLYMLATGAVWLAYPGKRLVPNYLHFGFAGLFLAVLVSWLASPWADRSYDAVDAYFKQFVFYVLLVTVVRDEKDLRQIVFAFLAVMMLYMSHALWEYSNGRHAYRMGTERMIGMDRTMRDPNSFGGSVVYALALVVPFWRCAPSLGMRLFLVAYGALSVTCILLTGSRTAFVGLLLLTLFYSVGRRSWYRFALPAVVLSPLIWLALPGALQDRFATLLDARAGTQAARDSADSRAMLFLQGMQLWEQNPVWGVGPDAFGHASGIGLKSHNLYGQTAGELGTLGVLALAAVVAGFVRNALEARRLNASVPQGDNFSAHLIHAVTGTLLLLLVMGWGAHNLFRFTWLWYGAFQILALSFLRAEATQASAPEGKRTVLRVDEIPLGLRRPGRLQSGLNAT
jgi:hypothetical protein